ncbi:MAG: cofactor assembly of complex C subunit B [Synechococcales cyanobacterium T60_A2020_003]|nr:cofactor assembly of complex C subunit B [Synechococcales cyanobacterium T60_A2020_003]
MDSPVLASTAFLTLLLGIGLLFFIRASTKDRTEVIRLITTESEDSILEKLRHYFLERAYRVISIDPDENQVTLEGVVRPSYFLAIFLTFLAGVGILCLSLVLALLFPQAGQFFPFLVVLAPGAGLFYWKRSERPEQVTFQIDAHPTDSLQSQRVLTVTAHRDELADLQRSLQLAAFEAER